MKNAIINKQMIKTPKTIKTNKFNAHLFSSFYTVFIIETKLFIIIEPSQTIANN